MNRLLTFIRLIAIDLWMGAMSLCRLVGHLLAVLLTCTAMFGLSYCYDHCRWAAVTLNWAFYAVFTVCCLFLVWAVVTVLIGWIGERWKESRDRA